MVGVVEEGVKRGLYTQNLTKSEHSRPTYVTNNQSMYRQAAVWLPFCSFFSFSKEYDYRTSNSCIVLYEYAKINKLVYI